MSDVVLYGTLMLVPVILVLFLAGYVRYRTKDIDDQASFVRTDLRNVNDEEACRRFRRVEKSEGGTRVFSMSDHDIPYQIEWLATTDGTRQRIRLHYYQDDEPALAVSSGVMSARFGRHSGRLQEFTVLGSQVTAEDLDLLWMLFQEQYRLRRKNSREDHYLLVIDMLDEYYGIGQPLSSDRPLLALSPMQAVY